MAYALQSMLKIRGMREERAQTELAAARSARAQAQHELEKKIEERKKFDETKEERRDKIFDTVMGRVVTMTDLDNVRSAVSGIDEQGMLLEEAEHKAEHVLEEREAETEVARGRFAAASKDLAKIVEHKSVWEEEYAKLRKSAELPERKRSDEYGSGIMEAITTNKPYQIGGNVLNKGFIENLPSDAVVEVPCLVDSNGIQGTYVGRLPVQCAAMNMTNINVQLLTIEAALTLKKDYIYQAVMLDPHASAELSIDDIVSMCDVLIEAHGDWLPKFD